MILYLPAVLEYAGWRAVIQSISPSSEPAMVNGISAQSSPGVNNSSIRQTHRLIHFRTGSGGGVPLIAPDPGDLHHLVLTGKSLTFAWQRDLIDLPPDPDPSPDWLSFDDVAQVPAITPRSVLGRCRSFHSFETRPPPYRPARHGSRRRLTRLALNAPSPFPSKGSRHSTGLWLPALVRVAQSKEEIRSPCWWCRPAGARQRRGTLAAPRRGRGFPFQPHPRAALLHDFRFTMPLPADESDQDEPAWRPSTSARSNALSGLFPIGKCATRSPRRVSTSETGYVQDLLNNAGQIEKHTLCRAIAGDSKAPSPFPAELPHPEELMRNTTARTYHLLDADSSQHAAIVTATSGASLVIDGRRGRQKSDHRQHDRRFLAAGKTVLFRQRKGRSPGGVKRRLDDRQLGDFCLELHSHKANKREIVTELGRCSALPAERFQDHGPELDRLLQKPHAVEHLRPRVARSSRAARGQLLFRFTANSRILEKLHSVSHCPINRCVLAGRQLPASCHGTPTRLGIPGPSSRKGTKHPWHGCWPGFFTLLCENIRQRLGSLADHLGRIGAGLQPLSKLGFVQGDPTWSEWQKAVEGSKPAAVPAGSSNLAGG